MADQVNAIRVDAKAPGRLSVQSAPLAPAAPTELTVRVTAISLNRGETKRAVTQSEPLRRLLDKYGATVQNRASGENEILTVSVPNQGLHAGVGS